MASCVINRNKAGFPNRVVTRNGEKSILFDKIMSIPFVTEWDAGIRHYANVLTDEFKKRFGYWERKIAANPKAVNKIKAAVLGHPNMDNIVAAANNMQNPVLVRKTTAENMSDRMIYSENLDGEGELFLYDETVIDDVDLEGDAVPDDTTSDAFEAQSILDNPNPVINLTLVSGEKVKAISADQAIHAIENITDDIALSPFTYENGEPKLYFMNTSGEVFENYADALRSSDAGEVSVGFISGGVQAVSSEDAMASAGADVVTYKGKVKINNPSSFIKIMGVNTNSDINTGEGITNNLIRKGYISGEKASRNGWFYYLEGAGRSAGEKAYNLSLALSYVQVLPGFKQSYIENGALHLVNTGVIKDRVEITTSDGARANISKEYIKNALAEGRYEELKATYPDLDLLIACMFQEDNQLFKSNTNEIIASEKENDARLRASMTQILQSLGISTMGMSEYLEKYREKNGTEPSAKALADLGEKVIALAEGAGVEDLAEETSHFLVETYHDQNAIEEVLPQVESTTEWSQYSKQYYDIYGKKYQGEELTRMVRKEILGKVLRNQFLSRFLDANIQAENQTFFQRLADMFVDMVRRLQSFFTTEKKDSFQALVENMANDALADNPNAFDITNLDDADFTLYSAADEKAMQMFENAKAILQVQLRNARKARSGMAQQLKGDIDRVEKSIRDLDYEMNSLNVSSTITNLVATTEAQANYLDKLVKAYNNAINRGENKDKAMFDLTDQANLDNINSLMVPLVNQLRGFINTDENLKLDPDFKRRILSRIDVVNAKVSALNADVAALRKIDNNTLVNRLLDYFNVDDEGREVIMKFLTSAMKDISWISRWFGTLEHSKNPLLGMLMNFISYNNYNANVRTQDDMYDLVRRAEAQDWNVDKFENLLQKDGDTYSSYLKSGIDYVKFRKEFEKAQAEALKMAMPEIAASVDEIVKNGVEVEGVKVKPSIHGMRLNFLSERQLVVYEKNLNDWLRINTETRYNSSYYRIVQEIYDKAGLKEERRGRPISKEAIDFNKNINARRYQVKRRFMDRAGNVDWDALYADVDALSEWKEIRRSERMAASRIDPITGLEKTGREMELAEDLIDLRKAWSDWIKEEQKKKGKEKGAYSDLTIKMFLDDLADVQATKGGEAAFDFLIANSSLGFSDEFWESMKKSSQNRGINSILDPKSPNYQMGFDEQPIPITDMKIIERLNNEITSYRNQQREIMKIYYEADMPGEIDYESMPEETKAQIKTLQNEIQIRNSQIRNLVHGSDTNVGEIETEYETNEAFDRALEDSLDSTFDFCRKHASSYNQNRMEDFKRKMDNVKMGYSTKFSPYEKDFIASQIRDVDTEKDMFQQLSYYAANNPEILDDVVDEYSKTLVLPYFKRFAPKNYKAWLEDVRHGDVLSMAQRILGKRTEDGSVERYISIDISSDYQEEGRIFDEYKNNNYIENSPYGYYQPKRHIYRDEEYYSHFGIKFDGDIPTQNIEEWDMINNLVALKRKALGESGYNEGERHGYNLYEIPQISKSHMEKMYQLKSDPKSSIRNAIRDLVTERVDDPMYGQGEDLNVDGVDVTQFKVIPKYYLRELEEPSDVSHDLVRSYTLLMLQSNLYNEKMNTIGEVMGLQQALLSAKFEKGVLPVASNTYNMFKEWMDAHYYGIRMNAKKMEVEIMGAKIDVSKAAMMFDRFVKYQNLAFSIPVALTGMATGQINAAVEGAVGQYINLPSLRFADREILKMTSGYISDVGRIDRQNKLYVLGERMGIYSIRSRTASAGFNRAARILGDSLGYKMMDVLNYPLAPKIMISVMDDTRMADDGKFYRYNSFARKTAYDEREKGRTISNKEIKERWKKLQSRSLYNMLDVKDGKTAIKEEFDTPENRAMIERQMRVTQREIRSLDNICDGVLSPEDKASASRNWMMSFTMAHRGWFQIAMQRAWKARGYNFSTGQVEEGINRTLFRYMGKSLSLLRDGRLKELFDVINRSWGTMPDYERTNLKRIVADVTVFIAGSLLWMLAMSYDDDDDRSSWVAQVGSYTLLRVINEIYSPMPVLLEVNAVDAMYNPFPVMQKMRDLIMPKNWSFDEVQSGAYEGKSKLFRLFAKQTFLKQWYALKDGESVYRTKKGWLLNNPILLFDSPDKNDENAFEGWD